MLVSPSEGPGGAGDEPGAHGGPIGPLSAVPANEAGEDAVLKLKGLPYSTTEQQIYDFFDGFKVKHVAFVLEPDSRPSGLAFAEFESKEEALKALSRNGEYIGDRYVRLLHVPKSEMEEQVRLGTLAIPGAAAKMRSRLLKAQPRPLGYMQSAPQVFVPTLMKPASGGPLLAMPAAGSVLGSGAVNTPSLSSSGVTSYLPPGLLPTVDTRLWSQQAYQQLPLHQQFGSLSLGGAQQHQPMGMRPFQMPAAAGQAYLPQVYGQTRSGFMQPAAQFRAGAGNSSSQVGDSSSDPAVAGLTASRSAATAGHTNASTSHVLSQGSYGAPDLDTQASAGMSSRTQAMLPQPLPGQPMGPQGAYAPLVQPAGLQPMHLPGAPMALGAGMLYGMQGGYAQPLMHGHLAAAAAGMGMPLTGAVGGTTASQPTSATVKVRGLPYRSSPAEILAFFDGYQYLPDSLQLGLDSAGRPSGEAWLTFVSPEESARAVQDLNRRYMGSRYIELTLC